MAKILITSVGTGDIKKDSDSEYQETIYTIDGEEYPNTLTSQVIVEHYGIDKIIFIGTSGSMWDNLYFRYNGENADYMDMLTEKKKERGINNLSKEDLREFCLAIDNYLESENAGTEVVLLDYSQNNSDEIWDNFEKLISIKEYINEGDKIYLDITHGFRYMPILNIFMLEFLKTLNSNKFSIEAILYGLFANEKSEIIDFKIFFDLLEWIRAIDSFKNYSDGFRLAELIETEDIDSSKIFKQFSNNAKLAHMHSIWKFIKDANKKIKKVEKSDNRIIKLLSKEITTLTDKFNKDRQSSFQFELAKWFRDGHNYALAYIALYEAIISRVCEDKGYDILEHYEREEAKKHVDYPYNKLFNTKYDNSISKIRNEIVHQNQQRVNLVKQDIEKLSIFLDEFEDFFK